MANKWRIEEGKNGIRIFTDENDDNDCFPLKKENYVRWGTVMDRLESMVSVHNQQVDAFEKQVADMVDDIKELSDMNSDLCKEMDAINEREGGVTMNYPILQGLINELSSLLAAAPTGGCSKCVYRPANGEPCDRCNVVTDCFALSLDNRNCGTCKDFGTDRTTMCPSCFDRGIYFYWEPKEGGGELVEGGQCDNDCINCDSHICCPTPAPLEKSCDACKYGHIGLGEDPCFECDDYSEWTPKDVTSPPDELFKCQVCGKFIRADEGITTLNGWWVCDNDSCRTLDDENEATEIPYKKWEPTTNMERRLLEVKDGLHQLLDIFLLKGIAVDALPTENVIALREMDCTNCNHKLRKFSEYPCNECMAYKTDYEKWEYPNHRDKSCGECEYVNRERNKHPCDICLASRMGSEWKPKEPVPINERKCQNCKHKMLKFDTAPCSECLSYKTNYSKWEWEGREWSTQNCPK